MRAHAVDSSTITQLPKSENKAQKSRKQKLRDGLFNALCIRVQLQAMHSPIDVMQNWKNYVNVTGFSCIPIGRSYAAIVVLCDLWQHANVFSTS